LPRCQPRKRAARRDPIVDGGETFGIVKEMRSWFNDDREITTYFPPDRGYDHFDDQCNS